MESTLIQSHQWDEVFGFYHPVTKDDLLSGLNQIGYDFAHQVVCRHQDQILGTVLFLDGGQGSICFQDCHLSPDLETQTIVQVISSLLSTLIAESQKRKAQVLTTFSPPGTGELWLKDIGFKHVSDFIRLQRQPDDAQYQSKDFVSIEAKHCLTEDWNQVLQRCFENSDDFPEIPNAKINGYYYGQTQAWFSTDLDSQNSKALAMANDLGNGQLHLACLAVLPEARRQGLARQALQAVLNFANQTAGIKEITVDIDRRNQAVLNLYEQFDFEEAVSKEVWIYNL